MYLVLNKNYIKYNPSHIRCLYSKKTNLSLILLKKDTCEVILQKFYFSMSCDILFYKDTFGRLFKKNGKI